MKKTKHKINVDDIIKEAVKLKGWYLDELKEIRIAQNGMTCCPITCGIFNTGPAPILAFNSKAEALHISSRTMLAIIRAADSTSNCNPRLRKKMLKAFGLTEK